MTAWLVKFTAPDFPLGHEEGIFEAAALAVSEKAGIRTPVYRKRKDVPRFPTGSGWNGSTGRQQAACTTSRLRDF